MIAQSLSVTYAIVDVYGPIVFTAILGGISWIIREQRKTRREATDSLKRMAIDISELKRDKRDLSDDVEAVSNRVTHLERQFPQLRESMAILAVEFEKHERFHERHN